jgi:hypothetical protein
MPHCPTFARRGAPPCLVLLPLLAACSRQPERGEPPPPPPAQSPCSLPQGELAHSLPVELPARAAGYCVDPRIDVRSYGIGEKAPLDSVCTELFNGECELYKTYGLEGVTTLEYAPSVGTGHAVSVVVSEFRTSQGAFGFLTRRILAGDPPDGLTVERLDVSGQGVIGPGVAYFRRGRRVVELTYVSSTQTPQEVETTSKQTLPALAREMARSLGGDQDLPLVAQRASLPGLIELGLELPPDGLFGLTGTGPYALAYFGVPQPHRLIVIESTDEASAKDTLRLIMTSGASHKLKGTDVVTLRLAQENHPPEVWYLSRQGRVIVGVGPAVAKNPRVRSGDEREKADEAWAAFAVRRLGEGVRHALSVGP